MTRTIAFASVAILAAMAAGADPVVAQAPSTTGITRHVPAETGNVVGGGGATLLGGGDDMVIVYSRGGAGGGGDLVQAGRSAQFGGTNGDGLQVEYPGPAPAGQGRQAWLAGGGDNAEVIYTAPDGR